MSRRRRIRSAAAMSLFPFLAVLICTMGSLIVLLVLLVQQARVYASDTTKPVPSEKQQAEQQKLKMAAEEQQWRRDILAKQRQAKLKQLDVEREKLSNLEDHLRDLKAEWEKMRREFSALQKSKKKQAGLELNVSSELIMLEKKIKRADEDLKSARKAFAARPKSYSIVPYRGRNGTDQRPIYLECLEDVVVIRPEGVQIPLDYLNGPLGAGNPLEAALRAVRDYWKKTGLVNRKTDPYPLIIVRPGSEWTYSRVREAMKSWEDQFGYELVSNELKLEFPPADANLAKIVRQEVAEAHRRQRILTKMRPRSFSGSNGGGRGSNGNRGLGGQQGRFGLGGGRLGNSRPKVSGGGRIAMGNRGGFGGDPGEQAGNAGSRIGSGRNRSKQFGQGGRGGTVATDKAKAKQERTPNGARQSTANSRAGKSNGAAAGSGPVRSLAKSNGKNWAIPNYKPRSAAFVRDIRVGVLKDKIVIFPDKGFAGRTKIFPIRGKPQAAIEEFVHSDIWDHVKSWGIASASGYWKPVLQVKVGSGAEARFLQLKTLLKDSGIEIKRN